MPITDAPPNWKTVEGLGWVLAADGRTVVLGAGLWTLVGDKWRFERAPEPEVETPSTLDVQAAADLDDLDRTLVGLRMLHPYKNMAELAAIAGAFLGREVEHDLVRQRFVRLARKELVPPEQAERARVLRAGREGATPPSDVNVTQHLVGDADDLRRAAEAARSGKVKGRRQMNAALSGDPPEPD